MGAPVGSLDRQFACPAFVPGDAGYAAEIAGFHPNVQRTPDIVVGPKAVADVVAAIAHARSLGVTVTVQGGGHGLGPIASTLLVTMRRLNHVSVDAGTRLATIGGGARWSDVIEAAAPHGLMPVIGSTSQVGAVGYLLGGGVSAIARSHGFCSDYVESFTLVTAAGDVVETSATSHPDLFRALRGGKAGFGIVVEARVRLVELETLYAGKLIFEEAHIEPVIRGWLDWTRTAHPRVTTSTAIIDFPEGADVLPRLRGRRIVALRFAWPGDDDTGASLAAPLRNLAPVLLDAIGPMPSHRFDDIHSDPTSPITAWISGVHLSHVDQEFATRWLDRFGAGSRSPFALAELRHYGSPATRTAPTPDAVGGRDGEYTALIESTDPALFGNIAPAAAQEAMEEFAPWSLPVANVNMMCDNDRVLPWPPDIQAHLDTVRAAWDPDGVFALRW